MTAQRAMELMRNLAFVPVLEWGKGFAYGWRTVPGTGQNPDRIRARSSAWGLV